MEDNFFEITDKDDKNLEDTSEKEFSEDTSTVENEEGNDKKKKGETGVSADHTAFRPVIPRFLRYLTG